MVVRRGILNGGQHVEEPPPAPFAPRQLFTAMLATPECWDFATQVSLAQLSVFARTWISIRKSVLWNGVDGN
ncbi:hypothetical protein ColTof3_08884 [Colletotrichum tofieldiae]|nr:hypothetical protein ColTof3_08884 [Colletotrichum tofieldiae]